jgi:Protein of unknown function (DUF4035)
MLCLSLGWSLAELKWRMSAAELQRWWAFYQVEPWGEWRGDLRMGILASALVNCWTSGKGRRTKPSDFLPAFEKPAVVPRQRQTAQDMLEILRRGTLAAGGRVVKKAG